jgi:hypothetical protein
VFAANSFVGSIMGSLGALVAGLPQYLQETWSWQPIASYKPLFVLTIVFSFGLIFAYASIDEHHVYTPRKRDKTQTNTKRFGIVPKLAALGMIDNFGAGLISPLMAYWFFLSFRRGAKVLGFMFFLSILWRRCRFCWHRSSHAASAWCAPWRFLTARRR